MEKIKVGVLGATGAVGQRFVHHWGRTLTESDNVLFSTLTLHYNPHYTNAAYAADALAGRQQAVVGPSVQALHHLFLDGAAGPHFLPEEQVGEGALDVGDGHAHQGVGRVAEQACRRRIGREDEEALGMDEEEDLLRRGEEGVLVGGVHCVRPLRESASK